VMFSARPYPGGLRDAYPGEAYTDMPRRQLSVYRS
jgi:hypothetical protein